jgi:hypothetical protein
MAVVVLETEVHREERGVVVDTQVVQERMDLEAVVGLAVSTT